MLYKNRAGKQPHQIYMINFEATKNYCVHSYKEFNLAGQSQEDLQESNHSSWLYFQKLQNFTNCFLEVNCASWALFNSATLGFKKYKDSLAHYTQTCNLSFVIPI